MEYEELWHRLTPLYEAGEAKAIVRWVLDVRFGLSWTDILCGKVTELSAHDQTELEKIMQRLEKGEPVQYIIGVADFFGRQFRVAPGVLIPRPETEELCRWILASDKHGLTRTVREIPHQSDANILDIGTGSGCIAITLALELPDAKVTAWDISDDALRIASKNAKQLGADVVFDKQDVLNISLTSHLSPLTSHLILKPYPIEGLDFVNCSYHSVFGLIESHWKRHKDHFEWDIVIPANTTAEVWIPTADGYETRTYGSGKYHLSSTLD